MDIAHKIKKKLAFLFMEFCCSGSLETFFNPGELCDVLAIFMALTFRFKQLNVLSFAFVPKSSGHLSCEPLLDAVKCNALPVNKNEDNE